MHNETLQKITNAAKNKVNLLNTSKLKYIVSSSFAGLYVGLGIILIFTIGGLLTSSGNPMTKILMGLSFAIALSLVVMTGSELFTGNNMIMSAGALNKSISYKDMLRIWGYSYFGNLIGSLLVAGLFVGTGIVNKGPVMEFFANVSIAKASLPIMDLFFRGILCNILVCVAILCTFRTNDDTAKLIIVFMCLFAFITSGFEHSIANMTIFFISIFSKAIHGATLLGSIYNLSVITLGNIVGGALVMGIGVYLLGREK